MWKWLKDRWARMWGPFRKAAPISDIDVPPHDLVLRPRPRRVIHNRPF